MAKQNKVAANFPQDFTEEEKAQARANIGAAADGVISNIEKYTGSTAHGPIYNKVSKLRLGNGGLVSAFIDSDGELYGIMPPVPEVAGKVLKSGTSTVEWADGNKMKRVTTSLPPTETTFDTLTVFTDGRVHGDSFTLGCLAPAPSQGDAGKVLVAYWSGSPGIGTAKWETITVPTVVDYLAGTGITSSVSPATGDVTFSWKYTVGRNLHVNQNDAIQTNLPGGLYDAPATESNNFKPLGTGANFAGAYRLMCRRNPIGTYELAIQYTASGMSSTITFIGTETVIGLDNSVTTNQAAYISEYSYYTPTTRFGGNASTVFNPTSHKAIIYNGIAQIGPTSDCKIAIWQDNGTVKVSFTAIEVGKVGSTV